MIINGAGIGILSASAILQIVPLLFLLVVLVVAFVRHQAARQQQTQGVLWLQAMRMLITHIQRHRGVSSGFLSGEDALKGQMEEIQLQVSRDFEQISSVGEWIKTHSGWQLITQHWARLAGSVFRLPVEGNIDQHNKLIKNILVLVDEIAVSHHLSGQSGFRSVLWRELLTLAELLGQLRVSGTVITSVGESWQLDLPANTRQKLQDLMQEVIATLEGPRCRSGIDPNLLQDILNFLAYIDTTILTHGPIATADEYYRVATATIDLVYEHFDDEISSVNRRLSRTA